MGISSIVFIDSRVAGYDALIAGLGSDAEWYLLHANQDGIVQMATILAGYSGLDSIHVISHGSGGTLYVGSTVVNGDNLYSYQTQLQSIGSSLTQTGDILLYGCDVALGDTGFQFITSLADMTGADVAASNNATGPLPLNGDSVLEEQSGTIDASPIKMESLQSILSGTAGYRVTDFGAEDICSSIAIMPDGSSVVVGYSLGEDFNYLEIAKYTPNGVLDTSFGANGLIHALIDGADAVGNDIATDASGNIFIAGVVTRSGNDDIFLMKLNRDGARDLSFGSNWHSFY